MPTIFNELRTHEAPPTFFQTNKITAVFQDIVEAYGVARYREVSQVRLCLPALPLPLGRSGGIYSLPSLRVCELLAP